MKSDIVKDLLHAAVVLNGIGCLPAADGNFSVRIGDNKAIITRKGVEKRLLSESDLVEVDLNEVQPVKASTEWKLHRALYLARPGVNAILHVHAPELGVFVAAGKLPDVRLLMETEMTLGGMAMIPFVEPGTALLGEVAVKHGKDAGVLLLERHGVVAVGASIREALYRVERAEFLARVQLGMSRL